MSVDIATLGIKVDASDVKAADRDLDNLASSGKRAEGSAKGVTSAFNDLKSALAILGIGAVARELGQMADTYKNIHGRLGLVTSGTAELALVSDKLFNIAQRTRTEFEAVTDLYGSLARSTKALGTSQGELLQVTETINQALIVSGANASSSEAALRQLGQGFASGALRGDELNSVLENTPRLAQAIADGMGVTVGQLRKLGAEGKITGEAVFNALKTQRETIEKEFATMPVTISQSFVQLRNEILKYVGEADAANGASASFSAGIQMLSKNLDSAVYVIELLVVAYGVKLVGSFVAATAAAIAQQAALLGLTTAAEVTGFAIGLLAARLAALSVVGAIAFAIVGFATETAKANAAVAQANRSFDEMKKRLDTAGGGATQAAGHVGGLGKDALGSIPKIDSFAGRVGNAAQQLYGMARAARAARVEMLSTQLAESQKNELQLASQTPGGRNASAADFRRGDFLNNAGIIGRAATGSLRSVLSGGRTDREAEDAYGKQVQVSLDLMKRIREARGAPITAEDVPGGGGGMPTATGGGGKTKGAGGGKSDAQQAYESQLKSSKDYLQAMQDETAAIGLNEIEQHRLAVAREAAKAPTEALRNSILAAGNAWETATVAAEANRKATEEATRAKEEAERANSQQLKDAAAMASALEFDTKLQGMNAREREVALATREMEMRGIVAGTAAYEQYAAAILKAAGAKGQLKFDADNAQAAADHIGRLNDNLQDAAKSFADLFDGAGKGFSELVTTIGDYYQFQADQEARLAEVRARYGEQSREYQQAQIEAREEATNHELDTYGRVLSGVKNLFSQKSAAYKVMEGIEKTYAAVRLALAIKEILFDGILTATKVGGAAARMATDGVETASSVSKSGIRAAADGVAAIAKAIASLPFPLNLIAGAATAAALVAFGVKVFGGGGGSKSASAAMEKETNKTPVYTGAYDEYGNPTSDYSVLGRGKTTVANDNGSYSRVDVGTSGANGFNSGISIGDTHLVVQGNLDSDVLPQVQQMLQQNNEQVVQDARAAVAADNAARANRQRIGGGK